MSTLHQAFAQPWALLLLAVLPVLGLVGAWAQRRRRRALARLGGLSGLVPMTSVYRGRRLLRGGCRSAGLILLILAIAGPQWGREQDLATAPGRDIVVVLDMSRSMLADDVLGKSSPNRLGRARDALSDLVDTLQQRGGHRLALVAFAARARVACPLTHDYDHFRDTLDQLDPADPLLAPSADGEPLPSDTRMGAALELAVKIRDPRAPGAPEGARPYQDVVLISDGDDPAQDGEWQVGVKAAREHHVPVYTVGVGDPDKGGRIPFKDGYQRHDGLEVWTRLQEKPLQEVARATGGAYIAAGTKALPLGELFRERIEPKERHGSDEEWMARYHQRYPWFLAPALGLLAASMLSRPVRRREVRQNDPTARMALTEAE